MLIASQNIEASLLARRLERWGAQTCTVSDASIAQALLPERPWHAVIIDRTIGDAELRQISDVAQHHATHRIMMFTPAERHDLSSSMMTAFTGYLVKPLRAASLAARLTAPVTTLVPDIADDINADDIKLAPSASMKGLSILVAEDNEINALLMRSLLTRLGHHPVITTNGEAALESWLAAETAGAAYDLVLMDVQMPELDGIETTKRIRAQEATRSLRRTKILALTANTLVEDRYACFEAGMDGFLIKPLDGEKLSEALAGVTGARYIAA